jgi:hypothetical protein
MPFHSRTTTGTHVTGARTTTDISAVEKARKKTLKESNDTLKRCAIHAHGARDTTSSTCELLQNQTEQIQRIDRHTEGIQANTKHAKSILSRMTSFIPRSANLPDKFHFLPRKTTLTTDTKSSTTTTQPQRPGPLTRRLFLQHILRKNHAQTAVPPLTSPPSTENLSKEEKEMMDRLGSLGACVGELKNISSQMTQEIKKQNSVLDETTVKTDEAENSLRQTNHKIRNIVV